MTYATWPRSTPRSANASQPLGRTAWLTEECRELSAPALLDPPVEDAWQRVKGMAAVDGAGFARGVALARWRERRARERDLPRGWVLKDAEILALAGAGPCSRAELAAVLTDNPAFVRKHADTVLELMRVRSRRRRSGAWCAARRSAERGGPPARKGLCSARAGARGRARHRCLPAADAP